MATVRHVRKERIQLPDRAEFVSRLAILKRECRGVRNLAKVSGIARGSLTNMLKTGEPSRPQIFALAKATGVRPEWLLSGEEPMRPNPLDAAGAREDSLDPPVAVPMYDIRGVIKSERIPQSNRLITLPVSMLRDFNRSPNFDPTFVRYWRVIDNTMAPEFREGDYALIDPDPKKTRPLTSGAYLFAIGSDIYLNYIWLSAEHVEISGSKASSTPAPVRMTRRDFEQRVLVLGRAFGKYAISA